MLIAPDISYYQEQVDDSFDRRWLIVRACDGSFLDPKAIGNADWCRGATAEGRIDGWTMYVVYRPGQNAAIMRNLSLLGPADRLEIDIESWPSNGKPTIVGDHSDDINSLALDLAVTVGQTHVWRYGNHGDLASIHPRPIAGQLTRIAGYVPTRPADVPNMVGWQYTNGVENHTANPSSTPPFGACDHNELYVDELTPAGGGIAIGGNVTDPNDPTFLADAAAIVQNTYATLQAVNAEVAAENVTHSLLGQLIVAVQALAPAAPAPATSTGPQSGSYVFTPAAAP